MEEIKIYNEDCLETIRRFEAENKKVNIVLTSPPYNTGRASFSEKALKNHEGRYDIYTDTMTQEEYIEWIISLFNRLDTILHKNGVILWNMSYGSDFTVNKEGVSLLWLVIAEIINKSKFLVADRIIWKKPSVLPNNVSVNKLTRIVEDIFVFCRKDEYNTFQCNKKPTQKNEKGQQFYKPIYNYIEAPNNDGPCSLNKATYSSSLCEQLLNIYATKGDSIYDPFMGSGTTAVACKRRGLCCYGSELSYEQVLYAEARIKGKIDTQNINYNGNSLFNL